MDFDKLRAGVEEISVSEGFVVDIESFSHLTERDTNAESRISSIHHSRKGSTRGAADKKMNPTAAAALEASSRATLPLVVVAHSPSDHATSPKIHHHQIAIKKGSPSSPSAETKHRGKKFGHHLHSPQARFLDPRKVVVFFATLSSMGTVLLIYFTLSMGKLNGDDNGVN